MANRSMKITKPGSHADHLLRQTRMDHLQLSQMADLKANMLLTMASLVVTLAIPHAARPDLRWPIGILIVFCLVTIFLAAYAAMPKQPLLWRAGQRRDLDSPNFNLLFFGDFTLLPYEEFRSAMEEVINDPGMTYEIQAREIYNAGVYLKARKYRYIQLGYITFLAGLATSSSVLFVSLSGALL